MARRPDTPEREALKAVLEAAIGRDEAWRWCRLCNAHWCLGPDVIEPEKHGLMPNGRRCPIPAVRIALGE